MKPVTLLAVVSCAVGCSAPREMHDVPYDTRFGDATTMDLYLPDLDAHDHATILAIHGGAWEAGDKDDFEIAGRRLANSGFAVASINYRLLPDGVFPNNAQDCMCAYAYLREHAEDHAMDTSRMIVMGYSAGGQLAGLIGLESGEPALASDCEDAGGRVQPPPAGVISGSGPEDMVELYNTDGAAGTIGELFGGSPTEIPDAYALGSPIQHVVPGSAPWLIVEDFFDWGGIVEMSEKLKAAGDVETLLHLSGSLHVAEQWNEPGEYELSMSTDAPEAWIATEDFLYDTVGAP